MAMLSGQVAVITGASSGIGKAIALALAKEGIHLCLVGRNNEALDQLAKQVRTADVRTLCCPTDLTRDKDIRRMETFFCDHFERLDILVHSAGVIAHGTFASAAVEDFDLQWETNVRAPYLITQLLLPRLRAHQGQIVFINSSVGISARNGIGQYAATKHALKAIADSLRDEVNKDGMRVLSIFLGRTATPMQEAVHRLEGKQYRPEHLLQPKDVADTVLNALHLPRTAEITDIHLRPMQKPAATGEK
jgi:NADP-dependent 3-hydroxy acid dehydrogenase YdfG